MSAATAGGVAIVGASHAGVQAAVSLRELGYAGPVRLLHAETALPYQRPPLSKAYLAGAAAADSLALRGPDFFAAKGIELIAGARVRAVEGEGRRLLVEPAAGAAGAVPERIDCDRLVLATGAVARPLPVPGGDDAAVATLRTLADADALRRRLAAASAVVVVGAGFIGLEVAATARALGKAVTVVESEGRVLARLFPPVLSDFLEARHRAAGTAFLFAARVAAVEPAAEGRRRVVLADGRALDADLVVVGIGAVAQAALAGAVGLPGGDGIAVDADCATAVPGVFAAGDCAAWADPLTGAVRRTESVQNAVDQAKTAAAAIAGAPRPPRAAPWFWSDQLDLKIQMVGDALDADDVVCRGRLEEGRFSLFHYRGDRLVRVDSVNRPTDHIAARRLVGAGTRLPKATAADPEARLKDVA
ncbi:NAD(P)/FAD-dependent oxidoreductase [Azospirillum sp. ST 5-10]|uniref:NAD(P)/FAD-dependent oxidoreductase n=1 Tax=unclassified Azospirillum TaxID=2630922 RepID=UPI003F4A3C6E